MATFSLLQIHLLILYKSGPGLAVAYHELGIQIFFHSQTITVSLHRAGSLAETTENCDGQDLSGLNF